MAPITEKTSPLPSKLKWLSSLKGNGTHNALWVTCDPFCLFWSDTTCHGKLDWPAHLKMCTFIFNFTGLLVAKYWLFLGEVSPQNLLWNRPIFLRICPWKSFEFWLFSAKIQRNRLIFPWILTFFLQKSHEIGWFFRKFAPENPAKFCLFSAKYQKPWFLQAYTVYLSFPQKKIKPRGSMHVSLCYPCT